MRYFWFIFLFGCSVTAQDGKEQAKEQRFDELVKKTSSNISFSLSTQADASKHQTAIVNKTVSTIISLKEENKDLKQELNEVKTKLDSVSNDTGFNYIVFPISHGKGH